MFQKIYILLLYSNVQLNHALAFDSNWVDQTSKKAALKLEKLDSDLKSAKSLSIKDCIRRGQEELADHFLDMGDLTNALKCYSRLVIFQKPTQLFNIFKSNR